MGDPIRVDRLSRRPIVASYAPLTVQPTVGGTAGAILLTTGLNLASINENFSLEFTPLFSNPTPTTVSVDGTDPINVVMPDGSTLIAGYFTTDSRVTLVKRGVSFRAYVGLTTLTQEALANKTINLTNNTLVSTAAQINAAVPDAALKFTFSSRVALISWWGGLSSAIKTGFAGACFGADGLTWQAVTGATTISDAAGLVPFGVAEPEHFATNTTPGTTDMTAAIQAMFNWDRDNGGGWKMRGRYYESGTGTTCYTSGDMSDAVIETLAEAGTSPVITIAPLAADKTDPDTALATAFNSALPLPRGTSKIAGLAASFKGKSVRVAAANVYIKRTSEYTKYRHDLTFAVLDDEGHIWPPLPYDVPAITFAGGRSTVIRGMVHVTGGTIRVTSGTVDRGALVRIARPNTKISGMSCYNDTTARLASVYETTDFGVTGTVLEGCTGEGADELSTNYTFHQNGGSGVTLRNCTSKGARRSFDGEYSNWTRIEGGSYPSGVGAHIGFDCLVHGAHVGIDDPNTAAGYWSGGDIVFDNYVITLPPGETAVLRNRGDVPELIGQMGLRNNRIIFDCTGETGTINLSLLRSEYTSSGAYDPDRDIALPRHVFVEGNTIELKGTGYTPNLILYNISDDFDNLEAQTQDLLCNVRGRFAGNSIDWNGLTPNVTMAAISRGNWTGSGFDFFVADLDDLHATWAASSTGVLTTDARARFTIERVKAVEMSTDPGAVEAFWVNAIDSYTTGFSAYAASDFLGDEQWMRKLASESISNMIRFVGTGAGAARVIEFEPPKTSGVVTFYETALEKYWHVFYDVSSTTGPACRETGVKTSTVTLSTGTTALTGAAGAGLHVAALNTGVLQVENGTGANHTLLVGYL